MALGKRGVGFSPLIAGIIVLIVVLVAFSGIAKPITKLIQSVFGDWFYAEKPLDIVVVSEDEFRVNFVAAYNYCGMGSTQDYCKCTVPLGEREKKKAYLKGEGEGRTLLGFFHADDEPELTDTGTIDAEVELQSASERFGPLCVHFKDSGIVGDPFMPPMPRLEQLGIILFKEQGNFAWISDVAERRYHEWPVEPAVFWRAKDNKRCFWGPRVVDPFFGKPKLVNDVPECQSALIPMEIASAREHFALFQSTVEECLKREPSVAFEQCSSYVLTLPEGMAVEQQADATEPARKLSLRYGEQEIAAAAYHKGIAFCTIADAQRGDTADFSTRVLPSQGNMLIKEKGTLCFSERSGVLGELRTADGIPLSFDHRIADAKYLSTLLNTDGSARTREEQWDDAVLNYAKQQNINFWLLKAIIQQESTWNPNAESSAASRGLMQVTAKTAGDLGKSGKDCPPDYATNAESNIRCGIARLQELITYTREHKLFELRHILAGYNGGEAALMGSQSCPNEGKLAWECEWDDPPGTPNRRRNEGINSYAQTRGYVPKVIGNYQQLIALQAEGTA